MGESADDFRATVTALVSDVTTLGGRDRDDLGPLAGAVLKRLGWLYDVALSPQPVPVSPDHIAGEAVDHARNPRDGAPRRA